MEKKIAALRVINAFLKESGYGSDVAEAYRKKDRPEARVLVEPKSEFKGNPNEFAGPDDLVTIQNEKGEWVKVKWGERLKNIIKGT